MEIKQKKGGKWLAFCVVYFFPLGMNLIASPINARIGRTVTNTVPVAVGHVLVFTLTKISKPIGIRIARSRSPIATLTTGLVLPFLEVGMYLRANPIMAKTGMTVPKIVTNAVPHPVVFAPTISVMAIGTRIATSNRLIATPTMLLALTIFVHGRPYVM